MSACDVIVGGIAGVVVVAAVEGHEGGQRRRGQPSAAASSRKNVRIVRLGDVIGRIFSVTRDVTVERFGITAGVRCDCDAVGIAAASVTGIVLLALSIFDITTLRHDVTVSCLSVTFDFGTWDILALQVGSVVVAVCDASCCDAI